MNDEPFHIHESTPQEREAALQSFFATARRSRILANTARAKLEEVTPLLVDAISTGSGQGQRLERLLWSTWNGDHKAGLCDCLCGLDSNLGEAVLALLAARVHLGGDADSLIQKIITQSGTQPPVALTTHSNSEPSEQVMQEMMEAECPRCNQTVVTVPFGRHDKRPRMTITGICSVCVAALNLHADQIPRPPKQ